MIKKFTYTFFLLFLLIACQDHTLQLAYKSISSLSIEGLRQRSYDASLVFEREMEGTDKWDAKLWSYYSDSLKVYSMVNTPKTPVPEKGYPVVIFGHGFHPDPPKYGISTSTGKDWRPGDYYRGVPEAFAERGYLVVTPDYRGHNVSEGIEFTKTSYLASSYYAIDVLHLIAALKEFKNVDIENIYYMGHSMGGDVGLKMLLATNKIKAASLWAPVCATTWEQALYYGKYYDKVGEFTDVTKMKKYTAKLDSVIQKLGFKYDIDSGDPENFISEINVPLILHHGRLDNSVPYAWSETFVAMLSKHGKTYEFYAYNTKDHLFQNEMRDKVVERDITFFKKLNKY